MSLQIPPILLVDGDSSVHESMTRPFRMRGYELIVAFDVAGALRVVDEAPVDMVVTELDLPDLSGHALIRELQNRFPSTPVVVHAAEGTMDDAIECLRKRVKDYLIKPVRADQLCGVIDTVLKDAKEEESRRWPDRAGTGDPAGVRLPPPSVPPTERTRTPPFERAAEARVSTGPSAGTSSLADLLNRRFGEQPGGRHADPFATFLTELDSGKLSLPVVDKRVGEFQRLMQRNDCGSDEVERVIGRDPALASSVLRASNTAFYSGGRKNTTVREACARMGNRQVFAVALEVLLNNAFSSKREPFHGTLIAMWKNSAATARAASRMARAINMPNPEEIYIAALLHNCGEMMMVQHLAETVSEGEDATSALQNALPQIAQLHEKVGGVVTRAWSQPPLVEQMASRHHGASNPLEASAARKSRQLIMASWSLAIELGLDYPNQSERIDPTRVFRDLGVNDAQLQELRDDAKSWMEG